MRIVLTTPVWVDNLIFLMLIYVIMLLFRYFTLYVYKWNFLLLFLGVILVKVFNSFCWSYCSTFMKLGVISRLLALGIDFIDRSTLLFSINLWIRKSSLTCHGGFWISKIKFFHVAKKKSFVPSFKASSQDSKQINMEILAPRPSVFSKK